MTRTARLGLATLTLCLAAGQALAQSLPTISVIPASAPNGWGSASFSGWVSNSLVALENGYTTYGTAGTPTYYMQAPSTMDVRDNLVTSFPSWRGDINPGTTYGAAFASELGNRLHFGLHILGNGTKFSISQLGFSAVSTDSGNSLGFSYATGSYGYASDYVGIIYGSPNTYVTSGPNSQLVDELISRGSGNAWWPGGADPDPSNPILGRQGSIDDTVAFLSLDAPFTFTGTYTLDMAGGLSGSGGVTFTPAPGSLALLTFGGLVAARRRRA